MKLTTKYLLSVLLFLSLGFSSPTWATSIIYVNASASPGGNGSSWSQAYNDLQSALTQVPALPAPVQIWIAAGTYKPSLPVGDPHLMTFNLPNNVLLYGGFKGNESSLSQRNPVVNKSILSGDSNGDDLLPSDPNYANSIVDNAYHVVTASGVIATLDGLTVQAGNASTAGDNGGGLLVQSGSSITLNNDSFTMNTADRKGGAIYATGPNTNIIMTNSVLTKNRTTAPLPPDFSYTGGRGGAMYVISLSSLKIDSSKFSENSAAEDGGALHINLTSGSLTNSSFTNNLSDHSGGAIAVQVNDPNVYNLTMSNLLVTNNISHSGGGAITLQNIFGNPGSTVSIDKSIIANNQETYINDGIFRIIGDGGAILATDFNLSISNSIFNNNISVNSGGAITMVDFYEELGILFGFPPSHTSLTINNTTFSGNQSQGAAQALYDNTSAIFGITVTKNFGGGAINTAAGVVTTVDNSVFFNNKAMNGNGGAIQNGDLVSNPFPGFYFLNDGTLNVSNSTFLRNSASANGGAISSISLVPSNVPQLPLNLSVSGSQFIQNNAASGKAIYIHNSPNTLSGNTYAPSQDVVIAP